jgi:hypothetical protein
MPFIRANFQPIGGSRPGIGGAPMAWSYKTADPMTTVRAVGYFNDVRSLLNIGDEIRVVIVTNLGQPNEALSSVVRCAVITKTATSVDVTDGVAESIANT